MVRRHARRRTGMPINLGYRLGVDTGGTFTDLTLFSPQTGTIWSLKVPSTPDDPSEAVLAGARQIALEAGISIDEIGYFGHGTTVATNTLIQLKGANCALITTAGFRDLLEIGRQKRPDLYDLYADKPAVLIPRRLRREVPERLMFDGSVFRPLDLAEVERMWRELRHLSIESVAVCFLYSYLNADHEQQVKEIINRLSPDTYVYLSSEILPEFREYERLSTTVLCAYLGPVVGRYTAQLTRKARQAGLRGEVYVTQSNGGLIPGSAVKERPVETALSGPASGVVASVFLGAKVGLTELITLDMGGTSADVSLISQGIPTITTQRTVAGYPVKTPMIDVHTIGAGGGSIAWIDSGGALKVGPMSAGASPGPACYGRGGVEPTVTDANLVLGRINPEYFLGGRMRVYPELARNAITERICRPLGMDLVRAARGILTIVNENMVAAIRTISVERGYDPREFTLLVFGGAGALHAAAVARELGIPKILVPSSPGTFSSMGLLVSDFRSDFVRTRIVPADAEHLPTVSKIFRELEATARGSISGTKVPLHGLVLKGSIDARYSKQNYELRVELDRPALTQSDLKTVVASFQEQHRKHHGYVLNRPVEFVSCRVTAYGLAPKAELRADLTGPSEVGENKKSSRPVYFHELSRFTRCPIHRLGALRPGSHLRGPAVIEQFGSTALIPPGIHARIDKLRNVLMRS